VPKKPRFSLKYIIPALLLFVLLVGSGVAFILSQTKQDNRNQAAGITSKGFVGSVSCSQVEGWACDAANFSQPLRVAVYYDHFAQENLITISDATINRADVAGQCGGTMNHGFVIAIPADKVPAGNHRLIVKGIPVGSTGNLNAADMFDLPLADPVNSSFNTTCGTVSNSCTLGFTATDAPPQQISCVKESFQDELSNSAGNYTFSVRKTAFEPGETVLFKITLHNQGQQPQAFKLTDILTENNLNQLDFFDTSCGAYNATTRTMSWTTPLVNGSDSIQCGFRARVKKSVTEAITITNTARMTAGLLNASCTAPITVTIPFSSPTPSPSPSPSISPSPTPNPTPSPTPICGGNCTTSSQCPQNHTCDNNICKLSACVNGASCTPDQCRVTSCGSSCSATSECPNDHTCSNGTCVLTSCTTGTSCNSDRCRVTSCGASCSNNADCPNNHTCNNGICKLTVCLSGANCDSNSCHLVNTVISQPRAASCNESCSTNADCQSANHICADTSQGRRCRLENNVNSTTCGAPVDQIVNQPVVQVSPRPIQPQNLPVAGSNDILKAVGVGAAAVILGAVGLLLL